MTAESHDLKLAFASGSINTEAANERLAERDDAISTLQAEEREEATKIDELEAVQADLQQRTQRAGAPLPAGVVVGAATISAVLGILSIYGAL